MSDVSAAIIYIVTIELLGLAAWPLARKIFQRFPDEGWAFAKIIGIVSVGWLIWFLSSWHLVAFSYRNLLAVAIVFAVASWLFGRRDFSKTKWRQLAPWIILEEIILLAVFGGWTYIRGFSPAINGLEKFMDYGFMVSAYKTTYFPPLDHFLSGETINYYYFGHYLAGMLAKLSKVPTEFVYNLQMSLIFALGAVEAFALTAALYYCNFIDEAKRFPWRSWFAGILAGTCVTFFGNLHTLIYLPMEGDTYWYPDATRFILNTIHEFPIYSFIVNDLHGHVSDIPIVLLILGIIYVLFRRGVDYIVHQKGKKLDDRPWVVATLRNPRLFLALALFIGTTYATNAWDFAIYLIVSGCLIWSLYALEQSDENTFFNRLFTVRVLLKTALASLILLALSILFYLPFWQSLVPISKGIGIVPWGGRSPLWQIAILWGVHVPIALIVVAWMLRIRVTPKGIREAVVKAMAQFLSVSVNVSHVSEKEADVEDEKEHLKINNKLRLTPTHLYLIVLFIVSMLLIIAPEIIFIRDIYPTHYRANTMFKFYYQAWIMLGILFGYGIVAIWGATNRRPTLYGYLFRLISLILIGAGLMYPFKAIDQGFALKQPRQSINGLTYLKSSHPADYDAIQWINQNITGQPIIAEGVGESYTDYARISSNTGLPAVMGWPVHEWLWRGSYGDAILPKTHVEQETGQVDTVGNRVQDMQLLYETTDPAEAERLLKKYHIQYVYVGDLERSKYPSLNEDKFTQLSQKVVYDKDGVKIYLIR